MCNCDLCVRNRLFMTKHDALPEDQREFFMHIYERLMDTEMDLNYLEVVTNGAWPNSIDVLKGMLKRAEAIAEAKESAQ